MFKEFFRYGLVSMVSLCIDFGCLLLLVERMHILWATACGFLLGGGVAYILCVRFVFSQRRLKHAQTEAILFVGLGLLGLLINLVVIAFATKQGTAPLVAAKSLAATISFASNFMLRKGLLFSSTRPHLSRQHLMTRY